MGDSIKVNNDVYMLTRYARGLTPEEQRISIIDSSTIPLTIGIEKTLRGFNSIAPDIKNPKAAWNELKATEQTLKGANFRESYDNFQRNLEIRDLEKRFRPVSNPTSELQKLQKAENIRNLAKEAKTLKGAEKTKKLKELQNAFKDFQTSQGMTKAEAKKFVTDLTDKQLTKQLKNAQKALSEFNQSQYYDDVRRLINESKTLKGKAYADKMKEIEKAIAEANQKLHVAKTSGALKPLTKRGKLWNGVKKVTGYNKAKGAVNTALTKSSKLRSVAKFGKANALTAVGIDLALAVPEIMATKQTFDQVDENGDPVRPGEGTGTQKALKQTGRVVATAGAQVAAYAIGAKIGTAAVAAAWAAKGAALGSVAPGVGTAIGAVVGLGVGLLSSWLAGKAMEKAIGKSELDQLQDRTVNQPAKDLAMQAQQDDEVLEAVLIAAKNRYEQDPTENKDIEKAYTNVVTAYQNGDIGSVAEARKLEKPIEQQTAQTTAQQSQQPAASSTTSTTSAEEAQSTDTNTTADETQQESTTESDSKEESKTDNSEKYKETIAKLDYVLNCLSSMNNQSSGGMYGMYGMYGFNSGFSNPMMFNNPFMMPYSGEMYA